MPRRCRILLESGIRKQRRMLVVVVVMLRSRLVMVMLVMLGRMRLRNSFSPGC